MSRYGNVRTGKEERSQSCLRVASIAANMLLVSICKKDVARQLSLLLLVRFVNSVRGPEVGGAAEGKEDVSQGSRSCAEIDSKGKESM